MTFPLPSSSRTFPESATSTSLFDRILSPKAEFCVEDTGCVNGTWLKSGPWVAVHLL